MSMRRLSEGLEDLEKLIDDKVMTVTSENGLV